MTELHDDFLRAQFALLAHERDDGDWRDVLARARRSHRRHVVGLAAAVAVIVVGVASAVVLGHPTIDFLSAKQGPHSVVNDFGSDQVLAPPGMTPGVLPHEARRITDVRIDGKDHVLFVAPTKADGFCEQWSGLGGGCRASRTGSFARKIEVGGMGGPHGLTVIQGSFFQANGTRLEIGYADGAKEDVPFVWVTKPINAGFYLFRVPDAHRASGHEPTSMALYDAAGRLIDREVITIRSEPPFVGHRVPGFPPLSVPSTAIWAKRVQLFDLRADNGNRIGLWIAPERGGGTCFFSNRADGCGNHGGTLQIPPGFAKAHPELAHATSILGLGFSGGNPVLLCCHVSKAVARVELRFQDGDRIELIPKRSFLIAAIPSRHYPLGHRLNEIVAYDRVGKVIGTRRVTVMAGVYPCAKPKNLGYGVKRCA